jgi:hypothetical protein
MLIWEVQICRSPCITSHGCEVFGNDRSKVRSFDEMQLVRFVGGVRA